MWKARKFSAFLLIVNMLTAVCLSRSVSDAVIIVDMGKFLPDIKYTLRLDRISMPLTVMITSISAMASLYIFGYNQNHVHQNRFLRIISLFTAFITYFICSNNLLAMCTGYGMATISAFFMLSFYDEKDSISNNAVQVTSMNFAALAILLVLSAVIFNYTGSYDFNAILAKTELGRNGSLPYIIAIAAFIMSGTFGLHSMILSAHKTSQTVLIVLYSAVFISSGLFLFSRFHRIFLNNQNITDFILLYCSLSSILLAFEAILQTDIKKTEILSVCSQISLCFLACTHDQPAMIVRIIVYHGLAATAAMLAIGAIITVTSNEKDLLQMGGIGRLTKKTFVLSLAAFLFVLMLPAVISQIPSIKNTGFMRLTITVNSFLSAFCLAKIIMLVFLKKFRGDDNIFARITEANPVILLTTTAAVIMAGFSFMKITDMITFDHTLLYQAAAATTGVYFSYRFNYRHIPSRKYEKVIDENKFSAIRRLIKNSLFFKPAAFCYKTIDNGIISGTNKIITSAALNAAHKLKKAKESNIFVYNAWIVISLTAVIIYALIRGRS